MKVIFCMVVFLYSANSFAGAIAIQTCVAHLKSVEKFTNDQAALACAGTKNAVEVQNCVYNLKSTQGFTNDQAAKACFGAGH